MPCLRCQPLLTLARAGAKKAASLVRALGMTGVHPAWEARTQICVRCPIATSTPKGLFCGPPLLTQLNRRPEQGCGCPVLAKAKDPEEHCPVDAGLTGVPDPRPTPPTPCPCKWCRAGAGPSARTETLSR